MSNARLVVIPGGGHILNYSAPLELSRVTRAFIEATRSQLLEKERLDESLGETYKYFLENCLPKGATIFIFECQRTWPTTQVDDRHFFQFGALGGATEADFFQGGESVAEYLQRYQSLG
jgi:hypothetical protein